MNFVEELRWRGMMSDIMPGTEDQLDKEMTSAYIGFDPTADSLHVGSFAQIMLLRRFQKAGHKPYVLVGGATGMIGDPSGKSAERNLLDEATLKQNKDGIRAQLERFLDFENGDNKAEMVDNYDWMKDFSFLEFIRDVGKHITVNYMMAKDSVKKRLSSESKSGMSFTEFTYQLVQGYDFYWLHQNRNCKLQMGGSDQWGNITTGSELIRKKGGGDAFALTIQLITKADGSKFGKTESGNIWLDAELTTPYEFYQFWFRTTDPDAEKYIKVFTELNQDEVTALIAEHNEAPHARALQKRLAKEITCMVHSEASYESAVAASQILFGKATKDTLAKIDEKTFLEVFAGVPQFSVSLAELEAGVNIIDLLAEKTSIYPSKGEAKRAIKANSASINQEKVANADVVIGSADLLNGNYILFRQGKKNYSLIIAE